MRSHNGPAPLSVLRLFRSCTSVLLNVRPPLIFPTYNLCSIRQEIHIWSTMKFVSSILLLVIFCAFATFRSAAQDCLSTDTSIPSCASYCKTFNFNPQNRCTTGGGLTCTCDVYIPKSPTAQPTAPTAAPTLTPTVARTNAPTDQCLAYPTCASLCKMYNYSPTGRCKTPTGLLCSCDKYKPV